MFISKQNSHCSVIVENLYVGSVVCHEVNSFIISSMLPTVDSWLSGYATPQIHAESIIHKHQDCPPSNPQRGQEWAVACAIA